MDRKIPEWVVIGAEVMEVSRGMGSPIFGRPRKIGKVHKNGNFTLEGSPQQYSPRVDYAYKTGALGHYSRAYYYPVNDALRAEMAQGEKVRAAKEVIRAEIKRLEEAARYDESALAAASALSIQEEGK